MLTNGVGTGLAGLTAPRGTPSVKGTGSFAAVLESSARERRTNQNTAVNGDSLDLQRNGRVGNDYQEKLDYLSKLNAETDWDSMTDVEKLRTFHDRYREMFGRETFTGLYTSLNNQYRTVYESYLEENSKYFSKGGLSELKSPYQQCYRQAYYGDVPEDELRAVIREKHQGNGSLESKYLVIDEYFRTGVNMPADFKMQGQIEHQIYKKAAEIIIPSIRGTGIRVSEHPRYEYLFASFAKGVGEGATFRPGWPQLASGVMDSYRNADPEFKMSEAELEQLQRELDEFLNEIIK